MRRIALFLIIFIHLLGRASFAQFNPQPQALTDKFFKDPEVDFPTPAFAKTKGFTTLEEMRAWLQKQIEGKSDIVSLKTIGQTQKGKDLIVVHFNKASAKPKLKVWLQGGLHGDEPAGTESLLYVIHCLLNKPEWQALLQDLEIAILPMANVDGYEALTRQAANGMDLNRDQTRISAPETAFIKAFFSSFGPQVALDFHEYRPYRRDFSRFSKAGVTSLYDAMFLYSGNLNVPQPIRQMTERKFVNPAKKLLSENGLQNCDYVTTEKVGGQVHFNLGSIHARSSASNYALTNAISTLFEIRGVGIGRTSFKRRVFSGWLIAKAYLQSSAQNADSIRLVLKQAEALREPVVVKSQRLKYKDTLQFIDISSQEIIPLKVTVNSALQSKPVLSRARPTAYLLEPSQKKAIRNLKLLGLSVDSLSAEKTLEVEAFNNLENEDVEDLEQDNEDGGLAKTSANTHLTQKKFPAGTYVVWLSQQRANLACEVLEPENPNGFVAMKVVKDKNGELPIYRYMKPEKP